VIFGSLRVRKGEYMVAGFGKFLVDACTHATYPSKMMKRFIQVRKT